MEAFGQAQSCAVVSTGDGTAFWSSAAWQGLVHSAHGWSLDGESAPPQSLPELLSRCLQKQGSGSLRFPLTNLHLDPTHWTLILHPLPGTAPSLLVAELTPLADSSPCAPDQETGTLLMVDDEPNILNALRRSLRRSGHRILTAGSGAEGLAMLEGEAVDIIISDQRMPNMTGVEFLRRAKARWPQTVRISLSGYTDLASISDAINEGAVFKFITKPWDDTALLATVQEAFARKRTQDKTRQLQHALALANEEQTRVNARLSSLLAEKEKQVATDMAILEATHAVFSSLPVPVLGMDNEGMIAIANEAAEELLGPGLLGSEACDSLPEDLLPALQPDMLARPFSLGGRRFSVQSRKVGPPGKAQGVVLTLIETGGE